MDAPWIPAIHLGCGEPAFFLDSSRAKRFHIARSEDVRHIDGSPAISGEKIVCGSCGKPVGFDADSIRVDWPKTDPL